MKVRIDTKNLDTETRIQRALHAGGVLEIITNSQEYEDKIANMPVKWRKGESSKYKTKSNLEILAHLQSGAEEWNGEKDKEIDIEVDDYSGKWYSKVVGYMIPGKPTIYVNTDFFDIMSMVRVVSNFLHEWSHTMGFRHSGDNFRLSLPYFLNTVVEDLYELAVAGQLTPASGSTVFPEPLPTPDKIVWKKVCVRKWYRLWIAKCYYVRA